MRCVHLKDRVCMWFVKDNQASPYRGHSKPFPVVLNKRIVVLERRHFMLLYLSSRSFNFSWNLCSRSSKKFASLRETRFSNLTLETWALKLDTWFWKSSRMEIGVLGRDCQLTFDRYCEWPGCKSKECLVCNLLHLFVPTIKAPRDRNLGLVKKALYIFLVVSCGIISN